jgi:hypothetical protein
MEVLSIDTVLSAGIGVGLAAACGFRVFVPMLVLSLAARGGYVPLAPNFVWMASMPAMIAFATATALEVVAYYVPWLDNLLDTVATPAAVVAGMITSASVLTDLPPLLKWTVAIIAGGGAAGLVQSATTLTRLKSTALTGGLANSVLATTELAGSLLTSIVAIAVPLASLIVLAVVFTFVARWRRRRSRAAIDRSSYDARESVVVARSPALRTESRS